MLFNKRGKGGAHVAHRSSREKPSACPSYDGEPEEGAYENDGDAYENDGNVYEDDACPRDVYDDGTCGDGIYDEAYGEESEDYPPEDDRDRRGRQRKALRRSLPFYIALGCLTVYAWLLPLRPSYSELERRDLAPFPEFSLPAFLSGDWFEGISLWFSDTFPGRESWVNLNSGFKSLYGIQGVSISGNLVSSDQIDTDTEKSYEDGPAATPAPTPSTSMSVSPTPTAP